LKEAYEERKIKTEGVKEKLDDLEIDHFKINNNNSDDQ